MPMLLTRLLPSRLRWRLISGFALIVAVLLALLTVAERAILEQWLRTTLVNSMETTIHAGLGNWSENVASQKVIYGALGSWTGPAGGDARAGTAKQGPKVTLVLTPPPGQTPSSMDKRALLEAIQRKLTLFQAQQLQTLSSALAIADEPTAMLDTQGDMLAGTAILSGDRGRVHHLNTAVLACLVGAARQHALGMRAPWTGQVDTPDGAYLVLLEPTDAAILGPGQTLGVAWLDAVTRTMDALAPGAATAPNEQRLAVSGFPSQTRLVVMMAHSLVDTEGTVRTVTTLTICGALVVLALAVLLSLLVVGRALRPFGAITAGAERLAAGDYTHRLDLRMGSDEVGRLAAAFDRMAAAIAAAFATQRRFVADASHELRTPVTALRGYTDVLLMGAGADQAEQERILLAMQEDLARMSRLVHDLLTLARLDGGVPLRLGLVPLGDLLAAAAAEGAAIARGTRRVTLEASAENLAIWGDRDRLRQVLSNVVGNACAYTQEGGAIDLRSQRRDDCVELEVRDNGPGIAPEDLARLGERFFRGDGARSRQTGGSGLGLAIARSIVQAHGGTLAIQSALGQGTTVRIRLPLARSGRPDPAGARQIA